MSKNGWVVHCEARGLGADGKEKNSLTQLVVHTMVVPAGMDLQADIHQQRLTGRLHL